MIAFIDKKNVNVSQETFSEWQKLLTLLAIRASVPCALIMRVDLPDIKVYVSSETKGNPYKVGAKEAFRNSGLYCESVVNTKDKLLVGNALRDPDWQNNPDIKLGMISYFGFPVFWPDGEAFGTICILDSKENYYNKKIEDILLQVKKYIESCLDLLVSQHLLEKASGDTKALKEELVKKQLLCCTLLEKISETMPER